MSGIRSPWGLLWMALLNETAVKAKLQFGRTAMAKPDPKGSEVFAIQQMLPFFFLFALPLKVSWLIANSILTANHCQDDNYFCQNHKLVFFIRWPASQFCEGLYKDSLDKQRYQVYLQLPFAVCSFPPLNQKRCCYHCLEQCNITYDIVEYIIEYIIIEPVI